MNTVTTCFYPTRQHVVRRLAIGLLLAAPIAAWAAGTAPTIKLFPTTVLEEIKHTGAVAREMETGLQATITRLDEQQKLYLDSKCEGNEGDPGCEHIARQLGQTYMEMLNTMESRLPEMEAAVNSTSASLEKRIRKELGQKRSTWGMQELLLGASDDKRKRARQPTLRGRSGMRLSDRFRQYYKLVSHSGGQANSSLTVVASDIYLDMQETSQLIAHTREEIGRVTMMEQLNQSFGAITPEMQQVVAGVKAILFGEEEDVAPIALPPAIHAEQEYESPLQL